MATHFHEAKFADGPKLNPGPVLAQSIAQTIFYVTAVAAFFHVDKVDHDQAAQVTQTHLASDFVGRFQVGARSGFFNIAAFDGAGGVDVD